MEKRLSRTQLFIADVRQNGDGAFSVYVDMDVKGERRVFTGTRMDLKSGRTAAAEIIWQARKSVR